MMKEGGNITILVLGDEGVGKSSLVSTFVSRHFSELVPGILTRVRLPPDPHLSNCSTTIIDTQEGDAALSAALSLGGGNRVGSLASMNSMSADSVSSLSRSHTNLAGSESGANTSPAMTPSKESLPATGMPTLKEEKSESQSQSLSLATSSSLALTSPFRNVDAIVLIYDLDRMETFYRLENHWLPLIERCYNGELPVIVAGNKMDLHQSSSVASASDNQYFARSRQQIISLLQRFKFVRQLIKCSAKNLLNVDEVFRKSQQSVLYPINPLYDLNAGKLTVSCSRAFTRIFRMFDVNKDGLLSDAELNAFQHKIWGLTLIERDFTGWKKVVAQHNSYYQRTSDYNTNGSGQCDEVISDGKFTVAGFLTIFDVFISQNRLEVPWKVLRTFGYDDALNLNMPAWISPPEGGCLDIAHIGPREWRLNQSEVDFLTLIFNQFDSDGDGVLSPQNMQSIFSVLSSPLPPWSERGKRLFEGCFSLPRIEREHMHLSPSIVGVTFDPIVGASPSPPAHPSSPSVSASGITICSSSLPSVDVSKSTETSSSTQASEPVSYLTWMNKWHMLCTISPSICRAELYWLGHVFEQNAAGRKESTDRGRNCLSRVGSVSPSIQKAINMPSIFVRALVIGSKGCGKTSLIRKLSRLHNCNNVLDVKKELTWSSPLTMPETSCSVSKIFWPCPDAATTTSKGVETIVHMILTEVPISDELNEVQRTSLKSTLGALLGKQNGAIERIYDIAVLAFDASSVSSFEFAKNIERNFLTEDMPRMFVVTTTGTAQPKHVPDQTESEQYHASFPAIQSALEHCKSMDLEAPLVVSLDEKLSDSLVMKHIVCGTQQNGWDGMHVWPDLQFRSTPHSERKRRDSAKRRKVLWIGALTAGVTVVVGLTITRDVKRKIGPEEDQGWLKNTFSFFFVPRFVTDMFSALRQNNSSI